MDSGATNAGADDSDSARTRWLDRLVLVRPGEMGALLWAWAYFFCLLTGYYMLRPVRETMGITGGYDNLPWLMTATLGAMALANPGFAALVSRFPRRRFIPAVYRFAIANILLFFLVLELAPESWRVGVGYAFYVWLSVYNLFAVSVFWAFMADGFSPEQGKRLFGFIGVGGTLGAICGAYTAWELAGAIGPVRLLLVSVVLLECAARCVRPLAARFERLRSGDRCPACGRAPEDVPMDDAARACPECARRRTGGAPQARPPARREPSRDVLAGLRLLVRSPYLGAICLYMLVFTTTSTLLYMEQGRIVEQFFPDRTARTRAFASLDLWTNVLTLATQVFLTGRVIRWIGLGGALVVLPALSLAGFAAMWAAPALGAAFVFPTLFAFQVLRRGLHYAIDRPSREVLFTVLGADEKYKSKSFIDTFVYRAGDMIGGWAPLGLKWLGVAVGAAAVPLAAAWIAVALVLGRLHRVRERAAGSNESGTAHGVTRAASGG